jgi:hypothetical protein
MGCGASKGKSEDTGDVDITFKATGATSMDNFFDQAKEVLDNFNSLTEPLNT